MGGGGLGEPLGQRAARLAWLRHNEQVLPRNCTCDVCVLFGARTSYSGSIMSEAWGGHVLYIVPATAQG